MESPQSFLSSKHLYVYTYKLLTVVAIVNQFCFQRNKAKFQYCQNRIQLRILILSVTTPQMNAFTNRWMMSNVTNNNTTKEYFWSSFEVPLVCKWSALGLHLQVDPFVAYCVVSEARVLYHKLVIAWCQIAPHLIPCHSKLWVSGSCNMRSFKSQTMRCFVLGGTGEHWPWYVI